MQTNTLSCVHRNIFPIDFPVVPIPPNSASAPHCGGFSSGAPTVTKQQRQEACLYYNAFVCVCVVFFIAYPDQTKPGWTWCTSKSVQFSNSNAGVCLFVFVSSNKWSLMTLQHTVNIHWAAYLLYKWSFICSPYLWKWHFHLSIYLRDIFT